VFLLLPRCVVFGWFFGCFILRLPLVRHLQEPTLQQGIVPEASHRGFLLGEDPIRVGFFLIRHKR